MNREGQRKKEMMLYTQIAILFIIVDAAIIIWSAYDWVGIPANHTHMTPTYEEFAVHVGDAIDTGQRSHEVELLEYNDVVCYEFSNTFVESDKENLFFSRVIGLPGDTIEIKNGKVIRNGEAVDENYTVADNLGEENFPPMVIPHDYVYLLNDNRNVVGRNLYLSDSRYFGPISMYAIKSILGRD